MSERANKTLAKASPPEEPRTYDAILELNYVYLSTLYRAQKNRKSLLCTLVQIGS